MTYFWYTALTPSVELNETLHGQNEYKIHVDFKDQFRPHRILHFRLFMHLHTTLHPSSNSLFYPSISPSLAAVFLYLSLCISIFVFVTAVFITQLVYNNVTWRIQLIGLGKPGSQEPIKILIYNSCTWKPIQI